MYDISIEDTDGIIVHFNCPVCDTKCRYTSDTVMDKTDYYTCKNCLREYPMMPVDSPDDREVDEMDTEEAVKLQLKSVDMIEDIAYNNFDKTINVSASPLVAIVALISLSFGFFGIAITSTLLQSHIYSNWVFATGFIAWTIAFVTGSLATIFGPVSSVYNGYKLYIKYNPDCTFTEFIYYTANYHNNEVV